MASRRSAVLYDKAAVRGRRGQLPLSFSRASDQTPVERRVSDACPNCGKPVLATDTACWHCGYALPRKSKAAAAPSRPKRSSRPATASDADTTPPTYDFRALAIYSGLTLLTLISLWLVMSALGRRPLLVRSSLGLASDWVTVTDSDLRYTLDLPPDWQWLDVAYRDQEETLAELVRFQNYIRRAPDALADITGETAIIGVGLGTRTPESGEPATFVVIGRSDGLVRMSPDEVLTGLGLRQPEATELAVDTHVPGQPQARFTLRDARAGYQCRYLALPGQEDAGYLLAACASQAEFGNRDRDLKNILDSFQLLER